MVFYASFFLGFRDWILKKTYAVDVLRWAGEHRRDIINKINKILTRTVARMTFFLRGGGGK